MMKIKKLVDRAMNLDVSFRLMSFQYQVPSVCDSKYEDVARTTFRPLDLLYRDRYEQDFLDFIRPI
jgi:hypothetical protein